ncbi:MAG TPA: sugar ABC transporter permease [Lachnospiraceae bacterium]|nr:sugar ABC transporter permease [Lachnospiraceae bacterium]
MTAVHKTKVRDPLDDKIFYVAVYIILGLLTLITLYPLIYIVSASFSDPYAVLAGRVFLTPVGFSLEGYKRIFANDRVLTGFANSIFYTVIGTVINIVMTVLAAYPLSRKELKGGNLVMMLFSFTMIFNAGMIPNYILMRDLNLLNTRLVMLLPGAISAYNMIIARTFFQTNIPRELLEAAQMDGCSDARFLISVVLPLSKAILAVLMMFYCTVHWNSYFNAFLYLSNDQLYPLQIVLRDILIQAQTAASDVSDAENALEIQGLAESMKYSLMIVSTIPMMIIYPFAQKYFTQGVMIGSIKG